MAPPKKYSVKPPRDLSSRFEQEQEMKKQEEMKAEEERRLREEQARLQVGPLSSGGVGGLGTGKSQVTEGCAYGPPRSKSPPPPLNHPHLCLAL